MTQPLKKRSEGRKKWEKGLDNSGNIEGNSATNRVLAIETPRRTMLKLMKAEVSVKNFIDKVYILRALQTKLVAARGICQ